MKLHSSSSTVPVSMIRVNPRRLIRWPVTKLGANIPSVRAGRDPDDLAREFEPTGHSIRAWVAQADRNEGRRAEMAPGLAAAERDELIRLRRENKQLRLERDILSKAAAWFARETGTLPSGSSGS